MSVVFAGIVSHAPGITGRMDQADPDLRKQFHTALHKMRDTIADLKPDAIVVVGAEHFANFFFDNMPAYCMGMAESYEGPIEDAQWLGIEHVKIPGNPDLSERLIRSVMHDVDLAYSQEWKFDHGVMVPLHFLTPKFDIPIIPVNINCQGPPLTPLHRAFTFGQSLRKACDAAPERIVVIGTGGISHWPCTPDSGKINEQWDRDFLDKLVNNRRDELLAYTDAQTYLDAGQGGFEIRPLITIAGLTAPAPGEVWFYAPIPIYSVGCTVAQMHIA